MVDKVEVPIDTLQRWCKQVEACKDFLANVRFYVPLNPAVAKKAGNMGGAMYGILSDLMDFLPTEKSEEE